jgi:hypothetical protein
MPSVTAQLAHELEELWLRLHSQAVDAACSKRPPTSPSPLQAPADLPAGVLLHNGMEQKPHFGGHLKELIRD